MVALSCGMAVLCMTAVVLGVVAAAAPPTPPPPPPAKPNVVVFLADNLGWGDVFGAPATRYNDFFIIFGPFLAHSQLQPAPHCPCAVVSVLIGC